MNKLYLVIVLILILVGSYFAFQDIENSTLSEEKQKNEELQHDVDSLKVVIQDMEEKDNEQSKE